MTALAARASLAVALGRRSALRDLAAVAGALAAAAFAAWLRAAGVPAFPVVLAMLGMGMGATFWWRGTTYTADALAPALALLAAWAAWRWRARRRRSMVTLAVMSALLAMVELITPLIQGALGGPPPGVVASLVREFTPLGAFLVVVGLATLLYSRATRLPAALTTTGLLLWHLLTRSLIDPIGVPVVVCGWAAIAVALMWIQRIMRPRAGVAVVTVIGVVLVAEPSLTRMRLWALGRDLATEHSVRAANELAIREIPEQAAFVAESRRVDTAILLSAHQAGRRSVIVPQVPEQLAMALDNGTPIIAFPNARAHLERYGFLFERAFAGNVPVSIIAGHVPCVALESGTWQDVSLLVTGGSFVAHGARPGQAAGGMVLRVSGPQPPQVSAIEPRSIPFDVNASDLRVPATSRTDPVIVTLASAPVSAAATAEVGPPVRLCAGVQRGPLTLGGARNASASMRMNESTPFGAGWHPVEADPDFFRWTAAPEALVRVSMAQPDAVRITVTATPAARPSQQPTIGLVVNGCRLPVQRMQPGQGDYEWVTESSCWRSGMNHMWIAVTPLISPAAFFNTHDTRLIGARIGAIQLARRPGS